MVCIEWTIDLHTKFMEVMQQLGEGRCFPKDILKVMKVSSLTKMQVASHLQKCRNNNWRAPKERKLICHPSGQGFSSGSQQRCSFKNFGTTPRLQTNVSNLQQQQPNPDQTQGSPKFPISQVNANNICVRGESSTHKQFYRPQLSVQPHNPNIGSSFSNTFLSVQNNVVGGTQQQHGSLFGILDSQGL
ncbi:two-component response regulator ORR26-like [Lycium barbarum]|uniref:two-component response regulator ORR26-like n=1 Tax=Lycium barbarum TaxID=112863 RepID=UPI00293EBD09|nr:two-component response regulator ORR26-like [Lycium barbarum]XP_060174423.1 two-component response regulator ORR26-like [Lycium barbarum]